MTNRLTRVWERMIKYFNLKKCPSFDLKYANKDIAPLDKSIVLQTANVPVTKAHDYGKVKIVDTATK